MMELTSELLRPWKGPRAQEIGFDKHLRVLRNTITILTGEAPGRAKFVCMGIGRMGLAQAAP